MIWMLIIGRDSKNVEKQRENVCDNSEMKINLFEFVFESMSTNNSKKLYVSVGGDGDGALAFYFLLFGFGGNWCRILEDGAGSGIEWKENA